jgi:hypothetical protein
MRSANTDRLVLACWIGGKPAHARSKCGSQQGDGFTVEIYDVRNFRGL